MRISAEQARQSREDVKAKDRDEARKAPSEAGRDHPVVELEAHEFPDASTGRPHRIKAWVPDIRR